MTDVLDAFEGLTRTERLEIAGAIAPVMRSLPDSAKRRKVHLYRQSDGVVTGHTTLAEVQEAILATAKIEFEIIDGSKVDKTFCKRCGKPISMPKARKGNLPRLCPASEGGCNRQRTCVGSGKTVGKCKAKPHRIAFFDRAWAERNGGPWRCAACNSRRSGAIACQKKLEGVSDEDRIATFLQGRPDVTFVGGISALSKELKMKHENARRALALLILQRKLVRLGPKSGPRAKNAKYVLTTLK